MAAAACAGDRPTLEESGASREVEAAVPTTAAPAADGTGGLTLRLAVGSGWSVDPADASPTAVVDRVIAGLLFEGLTRVDRGGTVQPALAERWFVSDDRLRWTFVLPDGLTDNQGLSITARDVKASIERLAGRGPADQSVVQLGAISGWDAFVAGSSGGAAGITAADDRTLVIRLDAPFEPLAAVLAEPAFGFWALASDSSVRTTGAFTLGAEDELIAVDPEAAVSRIELVVAEQSVEALLADGVVDWGVLAASEDGASVPGAVLRQPLDLRSGLVVRLPDAAARHALLGVLNSAELALELDHVTVAVAPTVDARPEALPGSVTVHLPSGPLASIEAELERQLDAAGVDATFSVLEATEFAAAVASGEASVFPMVMAGSGFRRSVGVSGALPGGVDDLFGADDPARSELVADILASADPDDRSVLVDALEQELADDHLWLPLGNLEVRIGLSERMGELRVLPDGTFDLSGFVG